MSLEHEDEENTMTVLTLSYCTFNVFCFFVHRERDGNKILICSQLVQNKTLYLKFGFRPQSQHSTVLECLL